MDYTIEATIEDTPPIDVTLRNVRQHGHTEDVQRAWLLIWPLEVTVVATADSVRVGYRAPFFRSWHQY